MTDLGVERSAAGITIGADLLPRFDEILTADALEFVADLTRRFGARRSELLQARLDRYRAGSPGASLGFREDTAKIRSDPNWRVAPPAPGLEDRRCEMTGPTSRKMTINALNSGAKAWMADFEDATAPTWFNVVDGQLNLYDAIRRQIDFTDEKGKRYEVGAVTWTNLLGCPDYRGASTLEAVAAFGKATWGRFGGEPVTGVDPSAPTPRGGG